jgi:Caspase domain
MSATTIPGRRAALVVGLNYELCRKDARLKGCIQDARDVSAALIAGSRFTKDQVVTVTDDTDAGREALTLKGIKKLLTVIARRTRSEKLELVYLHYSGHAVQVPDDNSDEVDGFDECLVAEDFETGGLLSDDWLNSWLMTMNPATRVVVTIDACHSGSALDLVAMAGRKILLLSGSMDAQTSAERIGADSKAAGAMTSRMLAALAERPAAWDNIALLQKELGSRLAADGFKQTPVVSSTHDVSIDRAFVPKLA